MIRRPGFGVVTSVVTVLVVMGIVVHSIRPLIPPVPTNDMEGETEAFLRAGRLQPIPWHTLEQEAVAEAQRAQRPILLFIGVITSETTRRADAAFSDPDLSRYVSRQFVPVRIDGLESPAWVNAMHPVSRLEGPFQPEAQIWLVSPDGKPFFQVAPPTNGEYTSDHVADELKNGANLWRTRQSTATPGIQGEDLGQISMARAGRRLDLYGYRDNILAAMDTYRGGFRGGTNRGIYPLAYSSLLRAGSFQAVTEGLGSLLASPMRDVLFGGFFHSGDLDGDRVQFDKWTVENAEMAVTLAEAYRTQKLSEYARAARATLDGIAEDLHGKKYLSAGEIGDIDARNRSPRHSFSPQFLRDRLTAEETNFAADNLGLDPNQNAQGVPHAFYVPPTGVWRNLRQKLRSSRTKPRLAAEGYASDHLGALARMIEAARILGDQKRVREYTALLDATAPHFFQEDESIRRVADGIEDGVLADYLAYADTKLQDYLATGRYDSLREGFAAARAIQRAFERDPGIFTQAPKSESPVFRSPVPELADNLHESTSAATARVLAAYGRLRGDTAVGQQLLRSARTVIYSLAPLAEPGGARSAGFARSAMDLVDGRYAIAVGPQAGELARTLSRRRPLRFVAAAVGDVRPDLAKRGAGIYLLGPTFRPIGPLGLAEAAARLPGTYKLAR